MVSYPDSQDRSMSIRRPPSVTSSRASTARRHRQHRSHYGGSSYQPQNEFPCFTHTGDVEIIIASGRKEQRYLLHRLILAQCSGFFEAGTSEEWSRAQEASSSSAQHATNMARMPPSVHTGNKKMWRYELDFGNGGDDVPMLVQKEASSSVFGGDTTPRPPPVRNKPAAPTSGFFRTMAGNFSTINISGSATAQAEPVDDTLRDYDNLFRIFYNYPPTLDSINIANAYVECKTLLQLADMYDALEVIGPRVDHHLLRFQGRLFKQIAKYPPSYLKLGFLARSKVIFSEALVHVVGQWPQGASQLRNQVPEAVMELIEDKVDELDEMKSKIEGKLFRLTLSTSRGERVTPSNNWLDWIAMSLFRQWIAENTTPPPAPILKDTARGGSRQSHTRGQASNGQPLPPPSGINTGRIFRLIGTGGNAYLNHDECKRFLKINPEFYTRENLKRFERRMEEIKNLAKEIVRPLMRNFLELDLGRDAPSGSAGGLPYLTCTKVEERDFPWDD